MLVVLGATVCIGEAEIQEGKNIEQIHRNIDYQNCGECRFLHASFTVYKNFIPATVELVFVPKET